MSNFKEYINPWSAKNTEWNSNEWATEYNSNSPTDATELEIDSPKSEITPIEGEKKYMNGFGGRTIFLPKNIDRWVLAKNINKKVNNKNVLVAKKGQINSFEVNKVKFTAQYDEYGDFTGYIDKNGSTYRFKFIYNLKSYEANSLQTFLRRDDKYNDFGAFSGITELSNDDLARMVGWGGANSYGYNI